MKKNYTDPIMIILGGIAAILVVALAACAGLVGYGMYRAPIVRQEYEEELARWQDEQDAKAEEAARIREQKALDSAQAKAETEAAAAEEPDPEAEPVSEPQSDPEPEKSQQASASTPARSDSGSSSSSSTVANTLSENENQSTSKHDFSGGRVLATTDSDNSGDPVYHTKDCRSAIKIQGGSEYWYDSAAAAENDGRRLCKICVQ